MHFDLGHHSKSRTRSVQLEKDFGVAEASASRPPMAKENRITPVPPIPSARSSSLPGLKDVNAARQYRSMLDVEAPPSLGPVKPLDYDEFYVDGSKLPASQQSLVVAILASCSLLPQTMSSSIVQLTCCFTSCKWRCRLAASDQGVTSPSS